jgi:ABC-2 type transport system ATP-binding protein
LRKSFGDIKAVDGLSLEVRRGEVFGFLGPNGAGKTTTINMVCGLLKNDAGEISANGQSLDTHYQTWKKQMGLCPQDLVIWESLTCLEQLEAVGRLYDLPRPAARKRALNLLDILGLQDRRNNLAGTLSGGMKRRLNLALALVHDPEVLILDEPQAGLDPQSRILVREYIRSLAGNKTIILTTHDMDEADRLADRIAIIDHGRLLVLDSPDQLKKRVGQGEILDIHIADPHAGRIETFLASLPGDFPPISHEESRLRLSSPDTRHWLQLLMKQLESHNLEVEGMTLRRPTLEDVFISLTGRRLRE